MSTAAQQSAIDQVDAYIAAAPEAMQEALRHMRRVILDAAPEAVEVFAYGLPGYKYLGRPLLYYGAASKHYALYGNTESAQAALKEDMKGLDMSKGTIRFPPDGPFPETLVGKLVAVRLAEMEAAEATRKAKTRARRKQAG
jgi:uncharacterized protein YdhG (YjbR/CyaY superfamily)